MKIGYQVTFCKDDESLFTPNPFKNELIRHTRLNIREKRSDLLNVEHILLTHLVQLLSIFGGCGPLGCPAPLRIAAIVIVERRFNEVA